MTTTSLLLLLLGGEKIHSVGGVRTGLGKSRSGGQNHIDTALVDEITMVFNVDIDAIIAAKII